MNTQLDVMIIALIIGFFIGVSATSTVDRAEIIRHKAAHYEQTTGTWNWNDDNTPLK